MKVKKPEFTTTIGCPICEEEGKHIWITLKDGEGRCPICKTPFTAFEEAKEEELEIETPLTED